VTEESLQLAESEQRYRAVIDNAWEMIQSVRPDGTFEFVNQAWFDTLGYTTEDLAGLDIWDIIHESSVAHCQLLFQQAIKGEPIPSMEAVFMAKDGRAVPVEGSVTSRVVGEQVVATHGFFHDITERLRSRELEVENAELVRAEQARYREKMAALGKLSAGLAHELNNPSAAVTRAVARIGEAMSARDLAARDLVRAGLGADQWRAVTALAAGPSSLDGRPTAATDDPMDLDRRERDVESWLGQRGIPQAWSLAPGLALLGVGRPDLDALADVVPDEALAPTLRWLDASATVSESTEILARSSQRISDLVAAVKGYTHMDRATQQDVDVHAELDSTLVILDHRLRDTTVRREYDRSLPPVHVVGNTLNQVWTNIVDNALDAMDGKGTLTIRTRAGRAEDGADGSAVVVEIEDDGPGIPDEVRTRIFEPFFTTKPQGQGTGLGLDTAWRVVSQEQHGTLTVDSVPGRTVFTVTLPADGPGARSD
jgi:PAS domain S-box-containing protein